MSIRIEKITGGRFGNKLLQYINLIEIGNYYNVKMSCCNWEGCEFFENIISYININNKETKLLYCKDILENGHTSPQFDLSMCSTKLDVIDMFTTIIFTVRINRHNTSYRKFLFLYC